MIPRNIAIRNVLRYIPLLLVMFIIKQGYQLHEIIPWLPVIGVIASGLSLLVILIIVWKRKRKKRILESVTRLYRGERSERNLIYKLITNGIPAQTIFHDLYFKKRNGEYAQVDLVVATSEGILVFEVKDYKGWIYGNENQYQWTQVLSYGKSKNRFYNPIMQNARHIQTIKAQHEQFKKVPFFSIIVFYGNCVLKEVGAVPDGTYLVKPEEVMEVVQTITASHQPAPYTDKWEVIRFFKEACANGDSKEVQKEHIMNIRNMLQKT